MREASEYETRWLEAQERIKILSAREQTTVNNIRNINNHYNETEKQITSIPDTAIERTIRTELNRYYPIVQYRGQADTLHSE